MYAFRMANPATGAMNAQTVSKTDTRDVIAPREDGNRVRDIGCSPATEYSFDKSSPSPVELNRISLYSAPSIGSSLRYEEGSCYSGALGRSICNRRVFPVSFGR